MSHIRLDSQAAALLKQVQKQTGPVAQSVEQVITKAASECSDAKPLTAAQLEKVLLEALPDQKDLIKTCCERVKGYHCDGTNAAFLTQILETRVVKELNRIEIPARPANTAPYRDPYHTHLQMDPRADVILLFNARDVDKNGRPLLMKIIARERADLSKVDLAQYRTRENQTDITKFDVQKVANNADYIEVQDADEMEFQFGDPLKQTSLDGKGRELSTSVKVNPQNTQLTHVYNRMVHPSRLRRTDTAGGANEAQSQQLDRQPVTRFDERIRVSVKTKDTFPEGSWLDDAVGDHLQVGLALDRGFVFEPGAEASVKLLATELKTSVPLDDAQMLGSPSQAGDVSMANMTVRWLLDQPVTITTVATATGAHDRQAENKKVVDLLYANKAHIQVGNGALNPMGDRVLKAADFANGKVKVSKRPLPGDPQQDGQKVSLTLDKGFLTATDGQASLEGWKVVAGFVDHEGKWQQADAVTVNAAAGSQEMKFSFDLGDSDEVHRQNKNLEVRLYNADGIPAERVLIPFREIPWGDS